jgi:hypothetical protein
MATIFSADVTPRKFNRIAEIKLVKIEIARGGLGVVSE